MYLFFRLAVARVRLPFKQLAWRTCRKTGQTGFYERHSTPQFRTSAGSIFTDIASVVTGRPIQFLRWFRTLCFAHLTEGVFLTARVLQLWVPLEAQHRDVVERLAGFPATTSAGHGAAIMMTCTCMCMHSICSNTHCTMYMHHIIMCVCQYCSIIIT